jgi:hypothetical protein
MNEKGAYARNIEEMLGRGNGFKLGGNTGLGLGGRG